MIPAHVKDLIVAVYGTRWEEAYLEWGTFYLKPDGSQGFARKGFGRALDADPPDDMAVFWLSGLLRPGTQRASENVECLKVFVMDDVGRASKSKIDPDDLGMFMPEPTLVVESSPGNFQWQWGITDGLDAATAKAVRAGLPWKSDATSMANLIRLPMGVSGKPGVSWKVREVSRGRTYSREEFPTAAGASPGPGPSGPVKKTDWTLGPGALSAIVKIIPNDEQTDHAEWIRVMHGIMGAGGEFEVFDEWSQRWTGDGKGGYDEANTRKAWDTTVRANVKSGGGLLRELAQETDSRAFEDWRKEWEAAGVFDDGVDVVGETASYTPPASTVDVVLALQRNVANHIKKKYGNRIRHNVDSGLWHLFDGNVWAPSPFKLGYRLAKQWADAAAPGLGKAAAAVSKSGFFEGVETILKNEPGIAVEARDFDANDWLLGTPGGTVDLRTGVLRRARASDMISRCTLVTPSAGEDCPIWKSKLIGWMTTVGGKPDLEMQRFLQQWAGYCLCGDTSEEKLLFLYGDGSNGKGSYVDTLAAIAGTYYVQPARDLFMAKQNTRHAQELASLAGARMVSSSEVQAGAWDEMLLKDITGGGTMSANFMRQNQFTFRVRFKVTISGNNKPSFPGRISQAIRRRFLLATFPNIAKPIDAAFKPGLMKEAPGILRWAINGLVDMQKNGGLLVPTSIQDATDAYLDDEDLFGAWLKACTDKAVGGSEAAGVLKDNWITYRNKEGNHNLIDSHRQFADEMQRRGYSVKKTKTSNVYEGIALKLEAKTPF